MSRTQRNRAFIQVLVMTVCMVCGACAAACLIIPIIRAVEGDVSSLVTLIALPPLIWASSRGWFAFRKVRSASTPRPTHEG